MFFFVFFVSMTSAPKVAATHDYNVTNLQDCITPNMWLTNSTTRNPIDDCMWDVVEWETNQRFPESRYDASNVQY